MTKSIPELSKEIEKLFEIKDAKFFNLIKLKNSVEFAKYSKDYLY